LEDDPEVPELQSNDKPVAASTPADDDVTTTTGDGIHGIMSTIIGQKHHCQNQNM